MRFNKYKNIKTKIDGIVFASKKESKRYSELKLMAKAKQIRDLKCQDPITFKCNGKPVFKYIADFTYCDRYGIMVFEDCKGFKTPVYRLKKKLIEAQYEIRIIEI